MGCNVILEISFKVIKVTVLNWSYLFLDKFDAFSTFLVYFPVEGWSQVVEEEEIAQNKWWVCPDAGVLISCTIVYFWLHSLKPGDNSQDQGVLPCALYIEEHRGYFCIQFGWVVVEKSLILWFWMTYCNHKYTIFCVLQSHVARTTRKILKKQCYSIYLCCTCAVTLLKIAKASPGGCDSVFIGILLDYCSIQILGDRDFNYNRMTHENDMMWKGEVYA